VRAPVASAPRTFISPQLASLVTEPPDGKEWVFELKYDGYRLQGALRNGKAALLTRRGLDWSHRFPAVQKAVAALKAKSAIIDGEVVVLDNNGRTSFRMLQRFLQEESPAPLSYFVFDLLKLDGVDWRERPLAERRAALKKLLGRPSKTSVIRLSEILPGTGQRLMDAACGAGFEGVIGKRLDAEYESGRSRSWVKVKCGQRQELVVVGYTLPRGSRSGIGALLLAVHTEKGSKALRYAGAVGTGFSHEVLRALRQALDSIRTEHPPFPGGETPPLAPRGARWVRPRLLAEVAFTEWTADGLLRHPSFQGLREDKAARDIIQEAPVEGSSVAGITISHATRVVYPKDDITKIEVAEHMERVAKLMLPHVAGRPLSFLRCPEGIAKECFFQKHVGKGIGDAVDQVRIKSKDGTSKEYAVVHDVKGLVSLVQFGILEVHLWGCREDAVEKPDRVVLDLDPDEGVPWATTVEAALLCRKRLTKLGLKSWTKTTGGKGIHVVVPIDRRYTWDQVRGFARDFAEDLEVEYPHDFVSGASKARRKDKIFVDWLRNGRGATWIAPWSTRARPRATVSLPLSWAALARLKKPDAATVETLRKGKLGADPWAAMLTTKQKLP
jgi:bifunctional non-homologous end joining protein LigD